MLTVLLAQWSLQKSSLVTTYEQGHIKINSRVWILGGFHWFRAHFYSFYSRNGFFGGSLNPRKHALKSQCFRGYLGGSDDRKYWRASVKQSIYCLQTYGYIQLYMHALNTVTRFPVRRSWVVRTSFLVSHTVKKWRQVSERQLFHFCLGLVIH